METQATCEVNIVPSSDDPLDCVEIVGIGIRENLPQLPPEVIHGVIRQGGKLILAGDSKAGKTFLLMELAIALAFGDKWCGLQCSQSKVLYVNLELNEADFLHRLHGILGKQDIDNSIDKDMIGILNARGKASNAEQLTNALLGRLGAARYDVVIIDPIYKVQDGDENSAQAIAALARELDRLAEGAGCTIIYSHHHPKYVSGNASSINRSAGSGVFGRDVDASIDLVELDVSSMAGATGRGFRMEFALRSFEWHPPVNIWFRDGMHTIDGTGALAGCRYANQSRRNGQSGTKKNEKLVKLEEALDALIGDDGEISVKAFRDKINKEKGEYYIPGCKDNRTIREILKGSKRFTWDNPTSSLAIIRRKDADEDE